MKNISVVIPIYNEQEILETSVKGLLRKLEERHAENIEVILVDNGSYDQTPEILSRLEKESSWIKVVKYPEPDFGEAVRLGVRHASKSYVMLLNADWWEESFLDEAYKARHKADMIIASKELDSKLDKRPMIRKLGTRVLTGITKSVFGYKGQDTHGLKLVNRRLVLPLIEQCKTHEILETELMVRAQRENLRIREIPCPVSEIRKARVSFARRCIRDLAELVFLYRQLGKEKRMNFGNRIHADDVGYNRASVLDSETLWIQGRLKGLSLLVNKSGFPEAAAMIRRRRITTTLHVNFVDGKPIAVPRDIPSLVNANGRLYPLGWFLLRTLFHRINPKDVEKELEAQLQKAGSQDLRIDGLDSHRHTHMFSPVAEVMKKVADEENLRIGRSYGNFRTLTIKGTLKKMLVLLLSLVTRFVYEKDWSFPPSWEKSPGEGQFAVASWEKISLPGESTSPIVIVTHPGLPFDTPESGLRTLFRWADRQQFQTGTTKRAIRKRLAKVNAGWAGAIIGDLQKPWLGLGYFLRSF